MKYLQFTVAETTGRTFEIPMDKLEEIIKTLKEIMLKKILIIILLI